MHIGRKHTDRHPPNPNKIMSASFDFSGLNPDQLKGLMDLLQNEYDQRQTPVEFSAQVEKVRDERVNKRINEIKVTVQHYETVNAAFEIALNQVLNNAEESRFIVSQLDKCRRTDDFRKMSGVYHKYAQKDLKVEEMLKTLCAVYRLKLKNYKTPSARSGDRAIVRKEIRCPYCGELALKLVQFLEIKGIRWYEV